MKRKREGLTSGINKEGVNIVPASYVEGLNGKRYQSLPERPMYLTLSDGQVLDRLNQPECKTIPGMKECNESSYNYKPLESSKKPSRLVGSEKVSMSVEGRHITPTTVPLLSFMLTQPVLAIVIPPVPKALGETPLTPSIQPPTLAPNAKVGRIRRSKNNLFILSPPLITL